MIGSSKRFAYLVKPELSDGDSKNGAWLIDAIMAVDPSERQVFLQNHVREQLARVLDTSPSKIDVDTPLINLGLDSLMAVEIGHRVQSQLGISIPAVKFLEGMTTAGMAQYLIEHLCGTESAGIARAAAAAPLQLRSAPPDTGDASRRLIDLPPVHGSDGMPHNGSGAASDEHSLAHMERLVANLSDDAVDALFEHLSTTPESLMPADWQPDGALRRAAGDGDD